MHHVTGRDSSSVTEQGMDWPQKWPWSVFWLKLCLESEAVSGGFVHKNKDELINIDASECQWSDICGREPAMTIAAWAACEPVHLPKTLVQCYWTLTFPRATWQLRIFVKWGLASAKQVTSQTGKLSLGSAGDTEVNPSTARSCGHLTSLCWNPKHRETLW